jgi:flagella basal body P-ring formation protein FlgA
MRPVRVLLAHLTLAASCGFAHAAADLQPLAKVAEAAEREALRLTAVGAGSGARAVARPPDARLRLARCPAPLAARASAGYPRGATLSIAVSCAEPPWQVYVSVTLHRQTAAVVAARPLAARTAVGTGDITLKEHDIADLPAGYVTDPAAVVGRTLLRPLAQGEPVERNQLLAPAVIERGQLVTLYWQSSGLRVSARGEARTAAPTDGRVRVRNLSSGRDVDGIVRGDGLVEVLP